MKLICLEWHMLMNWLINNWIGFLNIKGALMPPFLFNLFFIIIMTVNRIMMFYKIYMYIPKQLYFVKNKFIFLFWYLVICPLRSVLEWSPPTVRVSPHFFCDRRKCLQLKWVPLGMVSPKEADTARFTKCAYGKANGYVLA